MCSTPENQWENEFRKNIRSAFFNNFDILDESNLIQKDNDLRILKTDDFIKVISDSKIETGIMISYLKIFYTIYFFILDDKIFIVP